MLKMDYIKRPKIIVDIKGNFADNILNILNSPGIEYSLPAREKNIMISEKGTIDCVRESLEKDFSGYSLYANFQEVASCHIFIWRDKVNIKNFTIFFKNLLPSCFKIHADYDLPSDLVIDAERYLKLIFQMCKDVLIQDIIVMSDEETYYEFPVFTEKIPNTMIVYIGNAYHLASSRYYIARLLNNLLDEEQSTIFYTDQTVLTQLVPLFSDFDEKRTDFYAKLAQELDEKKKVSIFLSHHGYFITLYIGMERLLLIPEQPFKMKITEDAQGIDIPFYADLLLQLCRGIGISDFETYFNRTD